MKLLADADTRGHLALLENGRTTRTKTSGDEVTAGTDPFGFRLLPDGGWGFDLTQEKQLMTWNEDVADGRFAGIDTIGFQVPPDGAEGLQEHAAEYVRTLAGMDELWFRRPPDLGLECEWLSDDRTLEMPGTEVQGFWTPPDGGWCSLAAVA